MGTATITAQAERFPRDTVGGKPFESESWDIYPSVSSDGKYLFFTRRKSWQTDEDSDIYWVGTECIDRLKKTIARLNSNRSGIGGGMYREFRSRVQWIR